MPSAKYNPAEIEPKWQKYWEEHQTFRTPNPGEEGFDPAKPKYYVLDMFPYPSGAGLHVGHPEGYTATDILTRYKRMKGFNVLHPMGWDAYGLPAEQYAVQTGTHPAVTTQKNIASFRATLQRLGFSYDWSREVDTTDPDYYRWTQWIFLKLFNSIFDPSLNRARDVEDVIKDLKDGKIGLRSRGPVDAADPAAELLFDMSSGEARAAGHGKQWSEIDAETQWRIIANHRLAYVSEAPVWWCEALGTVLANEEVIDGRSERGDHPCVKKPLRQWMLRITAYAERLLADLDSVDWPDAIKAMQRHWIGKSEGAEVDFETENGGKIRVFTTRPDTLYGATYMVLAPEHPLVKEITTGAQRDAVEKYVLEASRKSDLARTDLAKDKSGVFTGAYAWNPVYDDRTDPRAKIPIWIADYVLMGYGTGAIMAVPAHDERDAEFALKYNLPIVSVVMPPDAWLKDNFDSKKAKEVPGTESLGGGNTLKSSLAQFMRDQFRDHPTTFKSFFTGDGTAMKSKAIEGLSTPEAKRTIIGWLEYSKRGEQKITYRLRDWLFSRQRYWGEPFPIVWDAQGLAHPIAEIQLPVKLPEMKDFKPTGSTEPPLSKATNWVNVDCVIDPNGTANVLTPESTYTNRIVKCKRETNSMPQWAGSCWYYLRYTDAKNRKAPFSREADDYWMNVDLYVGGAEHAVLHLLYSRFWHKVLYDHSVVHTKEPFQRLFNQGLIQAFVFQDETGRLVPNDEVEETPEGFRQKSTGAALKQNVGKMSKSLKNVIPADDVIQEHGADTLRLYEMFMGPLDSSKPWNPRDVPGMYRFLRDCWKVVIQDDEREAGAGNLRMNLLPSASENIGSDMKRTEELERKLHKTIKGVTNDLERMAFNTAISKLMVFKNDVLEDVGRLNRDQARRFVLLLAPFAPHLAEELWDKMRYGRSLAYEPWPSYDEAQTVDASVELAIQINGKVRGKVVVATEAAKDAILAAAKDAVKAELTGKTIVKEVVVPGRLVNFVVK